MSLLTARGLDYLIFEGPFQRKLSYDPVIQFMDIVYAPSHYAPQQEPDLLAIIITLPA